jgi:hypothetical protein
MAYTTTIGKLLIEQALPEDMRGRKRVLNADGVSELFNELAHRHPEQYSEVGLKLTDVGKDASFISGGMSVGVSALITPPHINRKSGRSNSSLMQLLVWIFQRSKSRNSRLH